MHPITFTVVDFHNPEHFQHWVTLLQGYACDPMGGGEPVDNDTVNALKARLPAQANFMAVMAFVEEQPIALANCIDSFSTFKAKPIVNIHDFFVVEPYRGKGVGQALLQHVEQIARDKGCCKVTLEVLTGNQPAITAYERFGFSRYELDPTAGYAVFMEKEISTS